jgi:hypothetical protein
MPIYRLNDKIIYYAHVPKSGGTSVNRIFLEQGAEVSFHNGAFWKQRSSLWYASSPQHVSVQDLDTLFARSFFDFKFTVVREPVERFLSAFNHNRRRIGYHLGVDRFLSKLESVPRSKWNEYMKNFDNHFLPAHYLVPEDAKVFFLKDGVDHAVEEVMRLAGRSINISSKTENARTYFAAGSGKSSRDKLKALIFPPSPRVADLNRSQIERIKNFYQADYERFFSADNRVEG